MQVRVATAVPETEYIEDQDETPSTNVSSPARGPPRRRNIKDFAYVQSKTRSRRVIDEESGADDSDFAPVREASIQTRPIKAKPHTAPITVDERLSGLNELQMEVFDDFIMNAKSMMARIKMEKSLRQAPFSDTILREMCLDLPRTLEEMSKIPNISLDSVQRYGKKFLTLICNTRETFGTELPPPRHRRSGVQRNARPLKGKINENIPEDPNHALVVDLISSDEDADHQEKEKEKESVASMDEFGDGYEEEDEGTQVTSRFFNREVSPGVAEFNRRITQAEASRANAPARAPSVSPPANSRAGSSKQSFKKNKSFRKRKSDTPRERSGGVTKRASSKGPAVKKFKGNTGGRNFFSGAATNRRPGGGNEGPSVGGSIQPMPS